MKRWFEHLISDSQELEEFGRWAFGEELVEMEHCLDFLREWNVLHGDSLRLEPTGLIFEDAPRMVKLWRDYRGDG